MSHTDKSPSETFELAKFKSHALEAWGNDIF